MLRSIVIATATVAVVAQVPVSKKPINSAVINDAPNAAQESKAVPASKGLQTNAFLAKIGNEVIRQLDFELFLKNSLSDQQRLQLQSNKKDKEQILNYFLRLKTMAAKAQKDGLHKKAAYTGKISIARMQLLAQSLIDRDLPTIEAKVTVTDEDVKNYFQANQEQFKTPEMFSARHILVSNKAGGDTSRLLTNEELQTKISKIQNELKNGKSFSDVAKEYSDDPGSKDRGGLYEDVAFGRFAAEFEQAVRKQEIDKVGDPIKTQYGYHLIEVKKITPAVAKTFDESKEAVKEVVTAKRKILEMEKYFNGLKNELGYKRFDNTID